MNDMNKFKKAMALLLTFVMVVSTFAVVPSTSVSAAPSKYVKSIKLNKSKLTMTAGKTAKIKATVKVKGSASKKVKVTLSKANKKVVKKAKVGKPNKKGQSTITFTAANVAKKSTTTIKVVTAAKNSKNKKLTKKIKVTVNPAKATPAAQVTAVTVTAPSKTLSVGSSMQATATVTPAGAQTTIKWSVSDNSVATVDATGRIVAMKAGTTDVIATAANGVSGKMTITVTAVKVTGVTLSNTTLNMVVGGTTSLTATVAPSNATDKRVTWTSKDSSVAKVDENGVVKALAEGTTVITVETLDGGYKATATVNVTSDSKKDVNSIELKVTNAIDGYENTVLAGTSAYISLAVTRDGAPYGNKEVDVTLTPVAGMTSSYELTSNVVTLDADGMGEVRVKANKTVSPEYNGNNAAYASFTLKVEAGGETYTQTIPVLFAQIVPYTYYGEWYGRSLTVDNQYDATLQRIVTKDSSIGVATTSNTKVDTNVEYDEEYVVEQEVDRAVVLDAAPMILLPRTESEMESAKFAKDVKFECSEYSVYNGVEDADLIEDVPGGLASLTLTFSKLQISEYTRIVVRAYEKDTDIPLGLEYYIDDKTEIKKNGSVATVTIGDEIFNDDTKNIKYFDLKIFAESAGQVNEKKNAGYVMTNYTGAYANQETTEYKMVTVPSAVKWSYGQEKNYSAETAFTDAEAQNVLGNMYTSGRYYTYSVPAWPEAGNAIIREYATSESTEVLQHYFCPTVAENNVNVLVNNASYRIFKATKAQTEELASSKFTTEILPDGRCSIVSSYAGRVPVKATVNAFDKVSYEVYSSVHFTVEKVAQAAEVVNEYYALAGQQVTLSVLVYGSNGKNPAQDTAVTWEGIRTNDGYTSSEVTKTNDEGIATLTLKATDVATAEEISVSCGDYVIKSFTIGGQSVPKRSDGSEGLANIHWVKPGIYYKSSVTGTEYDTSDNTTDETTTTMSYTVGNEWIVGAKVVGTTDATGAKVVDISNIKIDMSLIGVDGVKKVDRSNGVCVLTNEKVGESKLTAAAAGFINEKVTPVITIEYVGGNQVKYTSVGTGDYGNTAGLIIPATWKSIGANLTIINPNKKFHISNTEKALVFLSVLDDYGNAVDNCELEYKISNNAGQTVDQKTVYTDANGLAKIEIAVPATGDLYTIEANVAGEAKSSTEISFEDDAEVTYVLTGDPAIDVTNNTITLMFSSAVDESILRNGFFTLKTEDGKTIDIASITVDSSNKAKVVIKANTAITSTTVVTVNSSCVDNNITYYHVGANGVLYK